MRLDLFLKTARLIKRRTNAREMCESGRVIVNGREAKPAKEVKPGDVIVVSFSSRRVEIEVVGTLEGSTRKNIALENLYRIKTEARLMKEMDSWIEKPS